MQVLKQQQSVRISYAYCTQQQTACLEKNIRGMAAVAVAAMFPRIARLSKTRWQHSAAAAANNNQQTAGTDSATAIITSARTVASSQSPGANAVKDKKLLPLKDQKIKLESPPADAAMIKQMLRHIWPEDKPKIRNRVCLSMGLLIGSKILTLQVPFLFKHAIDALSTPETAAVLCQDTGVLAMTSVGAVLVGYGVARAGASLFNELRNAVFSNVVQHAVVEISRATFAHLHSLDMAFHLSRQTGPRTPSTSTVICTEGSISPLTISPLTPRPSGGLTRAIDRGTRGVNFLLTSVVFNLIPTAFEISLVCGILCYTSGAPFALITLGCLATYTVFTLSVTQWRTQFRKLMNLAENDSSSKVR